MSGRRTSAIAEALSALAKVGVLPEEVTLSDADFRALAEELRPHARYAQESGRYRMAIMGPLGPVVVNRGTR